MKYRLLSRDSVDFASLNDACLRNDPVSFATSLHLLYSAFPPVLSHYGIRYDYLHLFCPWLDQIKVAFDPANLFGKTKHAGLSQYYFMLAYFWILRGDREQALYNAQRSIEHHSYYVPASNYLASIRQPELVKALGDFVCPLPFSQIQLKKSGDDFITTFCCLSWSGYPVSFPNSTDSDPWNSHAAQEFRSAILDGSYRYCNQRTCSLIHQGALVPRHLLETHRELSMAADVSSVASPTAPSSGVKRKAFQFLRKHLTSLSPVVEIRPSQVVLAYDDTCNLACPSCRSSIKHASPEQVARMDSLFESRVRPLLRPDPVLLTLSAHGDPLASFHFRRQLQTLSPNLYPALRVNLLTNGLLLDAKGWQELQVIHDRLQLLSVSIDAASPATYSVLRSPGDWTVLMSNLEFIASIRRSYNFRFAINLCAQSSNFREILDFVDLGHQLGADIINIQQLMNWGSYTTDDFRSRNVSDVRHPEHGEFVAILRSAKSRSDRVRMVAGLPALI